MCRVLSLAPRTTFHANVEEHALAAAHAGYDAVGLSIQGSDPSGLGLAHDASSVEHLRTKLATSNLAVLDVENFRLAPETEPRLWAPSIQLAASVGAKFLLASESDPEHNRLVENFGSLCELALAHGLIVAMEFVSYRNVRTLEDAMNLIRQSQSRNARVCFDVLHFARSGGEGSDLRSIDSSLVGYVQLCDMWPTTPGDPDQLKEEAHQDRALPGDGCLPLVEYLTALPPEVPLSIEVPFRSPSILSAEERARAALDKTRAVLALLGERA